MRIINEPINELHTPIEEIDQIFNNFETNLRKLNLVEKRPVEVVQLPNEEDCAFVFGRRWHMHDGKICHNCTVMAVF